MVKLPETDALQYEWRQLEQRFQDFHSYRNIEGDWNLLRRREIAANIQPELRPIAEGIDFRSPALEKATSDWKAILKMEPTVIDIRVAGLTEQARNTERDLAIFFRRSWDMENRRREVDDRIGEGQVIHGVKFEQKTYKPFVMDEDGDGLPPPFSWENCIIDGFYWPGGVVDPEGAVWYRYSTSVVEAGIEKDGKKPTVDDNGLLGWLGAHEPYDYTKDPKKKVHVIVRDWPSLDPEDTCCLDDCDHRQRYITTYVCPDGKSMVQAEEVETVASPFKTNSFYAVGGLLMQTERDPHLVYRPLLLPLYELIQWKNYLVTLLAILVRNEAKDDSYLNAGQATPEVLAALAPEGEAGNTKTFDTPQTGANQMPVYPGPVERFPKITSNHLVFLIQQCDTMIAEYLPNRYLTGNADVQASNATGTAVMSQTEAASVVPSVLLAELDGFIDRSIRDEMHAYRYWSSRCPDDQQPRWTVSVTGNEATMRGKGKAGEQVYIDAKKCSVDYDLFVTTGNLTWAEKQAKWSLAKDKYLFGVYTVQDLMREAGIIDPELQQELLFGEKIESGLEPLEMRMAQLLLTREAAIKTGIDFGQLMQVPPVQPNVRPGEQPQPGGNSAPISPSTQAASVAHSMNPEIQMPAIGGPMGGNSGVQQ